MEINLVIVLLRPVTGNEALILQRVRLHETSLYSLLNFIIEFLYTTDTDFFAVLIAPDRQRGSPETRTREVPIIQVLQPVAKAACTS